MVWDPEWQPTFFDSDGKAASLVAWTSATGAPRFRLEVTPDALTLSAASSAIADHVERLLEEDEPQHDHVLDGSTAVLRVLLGTDGQWQVGSGWLNAPDNHPAADLRSLARQAVAFLRS